MGANDFDAAAHPRSTASGQFTQALHTAPEAALFAPARPARAQDAIDEITGGRHILERETRSGVFYVTELGDAQTAIWNRATGVSVNPHEVRRLLGADRVDVTPDNVERILEVAFHRATSGRYTSQNGRLLLTLVGTDELAAADRRADDIATLREAGTAGELDEQDAQLYAEHAIQNRPRHLPLHIFPRLAEFAATPFTEAGGATPAKVDALHAELSRLREGQGSESPIVRRRREMLGSYAMHA